MNKRMLPPINVGAQRRTINGRTYAAAPGIALDIPDFDAAMLQANGWIDCGPSGTTAQRPTGTLGQYNASGGSVYFDTTLGITIMSDGISWRDPNTGNAV
jgi:hypothetical protein